MLENRRRGAAVVVALLMLTIPTVSALPAGGTPPVGDCIPHPAIQIQGDEGPLGFAVAHDPATGQPIYRPGSGVVSGNGTAESPYVIEGWCIVTAGGETGISIENTDAHVTVRENVIESETVSGAGSQLVDEAHHGIVLDAARNVTIARNTIADHETGGVLVEDSPGTHVVGNRISESTWYGAKILRSDGSTFANNTVLDTEFPPGFRPSCPDADLLVCGSEDVDVTGNRFEDGGTEAIWLAGSSRATVLDNEIVDAGASGVEVAGSPAYLIEDNRIRDTGGQGIHVNDGHDGTIRSNTVTFPALGGVPRGNGIAAVDADRTQVVNNTVHRAQDGLHLTHSEDLVVQDNEIGATARAGIQLWDVSHADLDENRMVDGGILLLGIEPDHFRHDIPRTNTVAGAPIVHVMDADGTVVDDDVGQVLVTHSSNVTVENQRTGGLVNGIEVAYSEDVSLRENDLSGNRWHGTYLYYSERTSIADNHIEANERNGIYVRHGNRSVVEHNDVLDNGKYGVYLFDDPQTLVEDNVIRDSELVGLRLWWESDDGSVHGNNIEDNGFRVNVDESVGLETDGTTEGVNATENWWGCPDGPEHEDCDNVRGDATFDPWLTAPNPEAGVR